MLLFSFVIAVGVLLGKIKFFGVSLGVTFVLFTGIVCGHFGLTGNTQILTDVYKRQPYMVWDIKMVQKLEPTSR